MKNVHLSILALVLIASTALAPAALANGTTTGNTFSISLVGLPDTAKRGDILQGTASIYLFPDGTWTRKLVRFQIYLDTPTGTNQLANSSFSLRPGETRTTPVVIYMGLNSKHGAYRVVAIATVGTETLHVTHAFTVGA
jgi:hypothetical protein